MEQAWRWYGPNNPVSLTGARQADATGVITALHRIPDGEVWSVEGILRREAIVEDAGLVWSVVESIPIHEDIKTHTGSYEQWIANYQQTLRNLAQYDIRTMYYNFMPMLDWTYTDPEHMLPDSSKTLRFDQIEFATFEIHVLRRPSAEADYTEEEIAQATGRFATMDDEDKARPTRNIVASLPSAEEGYALDQFRKHLELYKDINKAELRESFAVFLKAIIPVAEEADVRMTVHPDNPPRPVLGLPYIVSTVGDMQWMADTVNSMTNDFAMCTGSYGARADDDLVDMIKQLGPRIYFTHLRSTICEDNPKAFHEAMYLNGDVDMYEVVKAIAEEEYRREAEGKESLIPMYPDHGRQVLDDLKKKTGPGYPATGRLKDLAEVRSVELAIQRAFFSRQYPPA